MGFQSCGSPGWRDFGTPMQESRERKVIWMWVVWTHAGVPGEKSHLDVGRVERSKLYYKGEGGGFPQVRAVVSLLCQCCSWLILAPKVFQLCASNLVWVVCRPV